jgi:predicted nucleic acid-binding protein
MNETPDIIIDTNVLIYYITAIPSAEPLRTYVEGHGGGVSFQTLGELRFVSKRRNWGPRLLGAMDTALARMIVVPPIDEIIDRWAQLMHDQMQIGSRLEVGDAWIAATALHLECPLLTSDRKDFARVEGLALLP